MLFFFNEDYNGDLRSLFHGTQHIDIQILTAISIHKKISEIVPLLPVDSKAYEFYQEMSFKYHHKMKTHLQEIINERITAVGDLSCFAFQGEQKIKLEELCGPIKKAYKFSWLMIEGRVYHSKSYKRVTKRNSYTICYTNQARQQCFGYTRFYVKCFKACRIPGFCDKDYVCRVPKYVVVLDRAIPHIHPTASPKKFPFCLPHIKPHKKGQSELDCCFVEDIEQLCVAINSPKLDLNFICLFPNFIESD